MSNANREVVEQVLAQISDPCFPDGLAAAIVAVRNEGETVVVDLRAGFPLDSLRDSLCARAVEALEAQAGIKAARVRIETQIQSHAVQKNLKPISGIKNIIAVASAKGGVGKSTTAANLALALKEEGSRVGILDADIYGPSQPRMLGLSGQRPRSQDGKSLEPLQAYGISCMSIGFLIDEEQPMVWRGPMVTQALTQLINDTNWGELDYLVVDLPPGTGDIQLTLSQRVPVSGAVIVTTPQDIALIDARKGLRMFEKVEVAVLGVVENMSTHICSACGHEEPLFGSGGGQAMAADYKVPFLGSLPLDIRIREQADGGKPTVIADPDSQPAAIYRDIARRCSSRLAGLSRDYSALFPKIVVEEQ